MKNSDSPDKEDTDGSLWFWVKEEASGLEVEGLERIVEIGCWSESDEVEVEGFRVGGVPD